MNLYWYLLIVLAGAFTLLAFGVRLRKFSRLTLPIDRSVPKGKVMWGIAYAYTLGMAPWAKESTRRHALAYLRGVAFHLDIFLCLALLVTSPWIPLLPTIWRTWLAIGAALGAFFGLIGFIARFVEHNLKSLSTPDDYFSVLLVSLFMGATALWLFLPATLPVFYGVSAFMLIYAPFSKIRHCIYFAFSRLFFGRFFGNRAVFPHSQQGER